MSIREKVARAMWADTDDCPERGWSGLNEVTKAIYQSNAGAGIKTLLEAAAEQGWHMRPDDATEEMIRAGLILAKKAKFLEPDLSTGYPDKIYRAMLGGAPKFEWDK